MIETGVNLTLQDNASASARRVAAGFEEVAKSADDINSALDPQILDAYNQKLTEIGESYAKLDRGTKLRDQYQAQQSRMMFAGAGSAVGSLSQGNIPGAVAGASKALGIKELISKVPGPIGIALAAAAATDGCDTCQVRYHGYKDSARRLPAWYYNQSLPGLRFRQLVL